jgi:hypothetical protein
MTDRRLVGLAVVLFLALAGPRPGFAQQERLEQGLDAEHNLNAAAHEEETMPEKKTVGVRGYLIHITHYDPSWFDRKERERPFDLDVGLDVVKSLAGAGFNTLIIDLADGVEYKGFPELKRHYSVPWSTVQTLAAAAREAGMEVVPKLNFSKGPEPRQDHNDWFRPYNDLPEDEVYWGKAFQLIDEVIAELKPEHRFFIGMDEDFLRTPEQYVAAVDALHDGLSKRGLQTVMWNDTAHLSAGMFGCIEKAEAAEDQSPKDIVHVLWDYTPLTPRAAERVRDMRSKGLEVWIAPGRRPEDVDQWKRLALQTGCTGMVMTVWSPVTERSRRRFVRGIDEVGPVYSRPDAAEGALAISLPGTRGIHVSEVEMSPAESMEDQILAPNKLGEPLEDVPYLLPPSVYLRKWMLLGPMPFDPAKYEGDQAQAVIEDGSFVEGGEADLVAGEPGTEAFGLTWRPYMPPAGTRFPQTIDLETIYGPTDFVTGYAVAHIYCEEAVTGYKLYLGSDDYVKVWLNGQLIHTWAERNRSIIQDDDEIDGIALRKGWNKLVLKCVNVHATWGFLARIADDQDRPLLTE